MPLPSGFKTKEEYAAYMSEYRKRKREEEEQIKVERDFYKGFFLGMIENLR